MVWVELYPPKYIEILIPSTCDYGLICKWGGCSFNQVNKRSYWIKVGPNPITCIFIRRGKFEHRDI